MEYKVGDLIWDDGDESFGVLIGFTNDKGFRVYWLNSELLKDHDPITTETLWTLKEYYRKLA